MLFPLAVLHAPPALAQSKAVLRRAEKVLHQPANPERLRAIFRDLSDSLRSDPSAASPEGWWLRGDVAAALCVSDERPVHLAATALDAYNQALELGGPTGWTADGIETIEQALLPIAADREDPERAYQAAAQLLITLELRRRLRAYGGEPVDPLHNARVVSLAVEAARATGRIREARKLFLDLDDQGGFMEPLALDIAREAAAVEGPQAAFVFLTALVERHPKRRRLARSYVELCVENGWYDEAYPVLQQIAPFLEDTAAEHLFVARSLEAMGRLEEAEGRYKLALARSPRSFEVNVGYAALLARLADRLEEGEEEIPPLAITHRRRAASALETALASNPHNEEALVLLAEQYRALGDDAALAAVERRLAALVPPSD